VTWMGLQLLPILLLSSCALGKPYYYNDSQKILSNKAHKGNCADMSYDCVTMSAGVFRDLTSLNPSIKTVTVTDCTGCNATVTK
jgi:hypothetical protein